jgi:hypothetical protein
LFIVDYLEWAGRTSAEGKPRARVSQIAREFDLDVLIPSTKLKK